jgi:hypothetical protein
MLLLNRCFFQALFIYLQRIRVWNLHQIAWHEKNCPIYKQCTQAMPYPIHVPTMAYSQTCPYLLLHELNVAEGCCMENNNRPPYPQTATTDSCLIPSPQTLQAHLPTKGTQLRRSLVAPNSDMAGLTPPAWLPAPPPARQLLPWAWLPAPAPAGRETRALAPAAACAAAQA